VVRRWAYGGRARVGLSVGECVQTEWAEWPPSALW